MISNNNRIFLWKQALFKFPLRTQSKFYINIFKDFGNNMVDIILTIYSNNKIKLQQEMRLYPKMYDINLFTFRMSLES